MWNIQKLSTILRSTRKAIGFKSLRLNCSDITQVNIKMRNVNYLNQLYLISCISCILISCITPPPLIFSREIYGFFKSIHRRCFMKKAVFKNFVMFTGKLQACNFINSFMTEAVII